MHISLLVTHHQEAIAIVKAVIARVRERRQRGSAGDLAIIVGAGHHSQGGARIRPAIERYLSSNSIAYCMVSAGEVRGANFEADRFVGVFYRFYFLTFSKHHCHVAHQTHFYRSHDYLTCVSVRVGTAAREARAEN